MKRTVEAGGTRDAAQGHAPDAMGWPTGTPWAVRTAHRRQGRPALEVYEHGELIDVLVASSLTGELLRGARRSVSAGRSTGFAWGRLAVDGSMPQVAFAFARLRPLWRPAETVTVAGEFWLAWAPGPLVAVRAWQLEGNAERLRPGRAI